MLVLWCIVFVISNVSAKQSPLHVISHSVGHERFTLPRRTPKVVFVELSDSNDNLQRNPYYKDDLQRLIDQIQNRIESLAQENNKNIKKKKRTLHKKNIEYVDSIDEDSIVELIKKAINKPHKIKKTLAKSKPQRTNNKQKHNYNQKINLEDVAAYLKTGLQKQLSSQDSKQNYLFAKFGNINSADRSPFNSDGMMYITRPKDNREPNLSALLKKVLDSERFSGTGRSRTNPSFNRDEIQKLEKIKNAIDNEDNRASLEFRNEAVQSLEEAVIRDEMADLQRAREQIIPSFKSNTVIDLTNGGKESQFDALRGPSRSGTDDTRYSQALRDLDLLAHGGKQSKKFLDEIGMLRSSKDYELAELQKGLEEDAAALQKAEEFVPLRLGNNGDGRRDQELIYDFDSLVY